MAVKLAHAMGAEVTLFTTSPGKEDDARRLGATHVVPSRDPAATKAQTRKFDLIINTVAVPIDLDPYMMALALDGTMVLVGAPPEAHKSPSIFPFLMVRRSLAGSGIGGTFETQEMLDFCAEQGVVSDIEIIPIQDIEKAYARMLKSDVKYRFVIDMQSPKAATGSSRIRPWGLGRYFRRALAPRIFQGPPNGCPATTFRVSSAVAGPGAASRARSVKGLRRSPDEAGGQPQLVAPPHMDGQGEAVGPGSFSRKS